MCGAQVKKKQWAEERTEERRGAYIKLLDHINRPNNQSSY